MSAEGRRGDGPRPDLGTRFIRQLTRDGTLAPGDKLVVALSGGVDSLVLLHLLRFSQPRPSLRIVAAHFDHRMRPDSGEDLLWVKGLCRAWEVSLHTAVADPATHLRGSGSEGEIRVPHGGEGEGGGQVDPYRAPCR